VAVCEVELEVWAKVCNSLVVLPSVAVNVPETIDIPERPPAEMSPSPSLSTMLVPVPSLPVIRAVPCTWSVWAGAVWLMPTLPVLVILIFSASAELAAVVSKAKYPAYPAPAASFNPLIIAKG